MPGRKRGGRKWRCEVKAGGNRGLMPDVTLQWYSQDSGREAIQLGQTSKQLFSNSLLKLKEINGRHKNDRKHDIKL